MTEGNSMSIDFLFDISKEVKQFYETPVIYLTKKDYADSIFSALCTLRHALENDSKSDVMDIMVDVHLQWLRNVNEIEIYRKVKHDTTQVDVCKAITYTIEALAARLKYYQRYVEGNRVGLTNINQANLLADLEIVEEMHRDVTQRLQEKMKCFKNFASGYELTVKLTDAIDELLIWYDKINDSFCTTISKYVGIQGKHLDSDLTKTLYTIVDELHTSRSPSAQRILTEMKEKGKEISTMIRSTAGHSLEISKVLEKISVLEDRIKRLGSGQPSAAVMALKYKKEYLEGRLSSLENLKTTLKNLHNAADIKLEEVDDEEICSCEDFYKLRIFNHSLPLEEREKLVTKLCSLWNFSIFGDQKVKSVISILSIADTKQENTDEHGTYYVDEHSRKVYKMPNDETLYQPNENNELVPISDDAEHVYFYDECGRYFRDPKTRQRIYKAHSTASEYMMDSTGVLLKVKEVRDGVTYRYDSYGRYYVDSDGKQIYKDVDRASEYENDGLGNLVRIRSHSDLLELCPDDEHVTEDFQYLKQNVGTALRVCIADCILHKPVDPIKYLSSCLMKYRENIEIQERRSREKDELNVEREIVAAEERAAAERAALEAALLVQGGSEASYDTNLMKYSPIDVDEDIGSASSK